MPSLVPSNAETLEKSLFASMVWDKAIKELISLEFTSHLKVLLPSKFKVTNAHRARSISQFYLQEYTSIKTGRSMQLFMSPHTVVNANTCCRASSDMTLPRHCLLCCTGHHHFFSSLFLFFPPLLIPDRCP